MQPPPSLLRGPWAHLISRTKTGVVAFEFQALHGDTIQVKGRVLPDAKQFVVNLGQDPENLLLHFNPRFDHQNHRNTIVCNSMEDGAWGEEKSFAKFPFEKGGRVQLSFTFLTSQIKVLVDEEYEISFPNRLGLRVLEYIAVEGDFRIRALRFFDS